MIKISHNLADLIVIVDYHNDEAYQRLDEDVQLDGKVSESGEVEGTPSLTYITYFSPFF